MLINDAFKLTYLIDMLKYYQWRKNMSTKFALLGLLNIKSMSAYEIEKFAKESIGYFWNESYSNVHRTLKNLTEENLITKVPELGSRNKKYYQITDHGKQSLSNWLSNHQHTTIYRDELLLKVFVSKKSDYPYILEDLKNVLNDSYNQKQIFEELQKYVSNKNDNISFGLVLSYGMMQLDLSIEWLNKAIKTIEENL